MHSYSLSAAAGLALSLAAVSHAASAASTVIDRGRVQARNGVMVDFVASIDDGRELMHYTLPDGRTLDAAQFRAWEQANPRPIIDQDLLDRAAAAAKAGDGNTLISVTVALKNNPFPRIMRAAREGLAEEFAMLKAEADAVANEQFPPGVLSPAAQEGLADATRRGLFALTDAQRARLRNLAERNEALERALRDEVVKATLPLITDEQDALAKAVLALGGQVESRLLLLNGASVRVPLTRLAELAALPGVARVFENPVGKKELSITVPSLGVPAGFWANGFTGGIWDAGTFDSGAQQNHPDIDHLTFLRAPGVGTTDTDGHGTAVCSIIASDDPTNRGVAFGITTFLLGTPGSFTSHANWMWATASDDADVMNMSWNLGNPPFEYGDLEQFVDGMVDDTSNLFVKSCGNEGPGDNTLTRPGNAYNGLSVANMTFFGTQSRTDDNITGSSSRGPTTSGRRKPDVAAPGQGVQAANNLWSTQADFVGFGGTSAAAPHVTGGLLLLNDAGYTSTALARAIIINTADAFDDNDTVTGTDDALVTGSQWNKTYGWGYINLGRAYTNRAASFTATIDDGITPPGPDFKLYRGNMGAGAKATLVWNRHVGWNGASFPTAIQDLSNLNLLAYSATDGSLLDSSTTTVNNIEQVGTATAFGDTVLKVDVFGALDPDVPTETYALATPPGFVAAAAPSLTTSATSIDVSAGFEFNYVINVSNAGDVPAHDVNVTLTLPAGWGLVTGTTTNQIARIEGGAVGSTRFRVRAACTGASGAFTYAVSSFSYSETFTASGGSTITINPTAAALVQDTSVTGNVIPRTYPITVTAGDFNVVALRATGATAADLDIRLDTDLCANGTEADSTAGGSTRDFVIANSNNASVATGTAWVQAYRFSGSVDDHAIELDRGFDVGYGVVRTSAVAASEIIEVYEVSVPGSAVGKPQRLTVNVTSGTIDPEVHLFQPNTAYASRADASLTRNLGGPGANERKTFVPGVSGTWGVVVVNANAAAGTLAFRLGCVADFDGDGARSIDDIFIYLNAWFASDPETDVDNSGTRSIDDIFIFLNYWFAGC